MFGLGLPEILIIAAIVILVFGARRLPELGKALGSTVKSFKKGLKGDEDERPIRDIEVSSPDEKPRPKN